MQRLVVVVKRDNASEKKSQEVKEFFESKGIRNHFGAARNVTFKARIGTTPHHLMYGGKKDVSGF
jgi:hypothetical protein